MDTLKYITEKYNLEIDTNIPVEIPNVGRDNLAEWIHELDFKIGVEVGVATGAYSFVLCSNNPQMELFGIDPFLSYKGYTDYTKKSTFDTLEKQAIENLSSFTNYKFIKKMSMDAVKDFGDESLDFAYLDANHKAPFIFQDIEIWYKKVRKGGILAGHDFIDIKINEWDVKRAVYKYTKDNNIKPWFVLGRKERNEGEIREKYRSWMIVKL